MSFVDFAKGEFQECTRDLLEDVGDVIDTGFAGHFDRELGLWRGKRVVVKWLRTGKR